MKMKLKTADPAGVKTSGLIVFLFTEDRPDLNRRPELAGLKKIIGPRLKAGDFKAEHLAGLTLFPEKASGPQRILLMGLGAEKDCRPDRLRAAAAQAVRNVQGLELTEAALVLPPPRPNLEDPVVIAEAAALGAWLGLYRYTELKTRNKEEKPPLEALTMVRSDETHAKATQAALQAAEITAQSIKTVRDLVNRPANLLYPETLAEEAKKLAGEYGLKIKVLDMAAAGRKKMGAFLGVAQGSARPGRVIILEYRGASVRTKPLVLVGKAITFDSGGLSLKSGENMGNMKTDMAGGAAVLGVLAGAARLKLKLNLVGLIPAAENMPDGGAIRPGDVLTSRSGRTIEVISTDAEGRLILADALTLALEYQPKAVIDLATLTGACVVALGNKCAGLMGTAPDLIEGLKKSGQATGERVWELPLFDDYFEVLKSEVADFKNSGGRNAGAITAGLFLKKFVNDTPWAHVDIAGPARTDQASPDTPVGGTGFGVGLLLHYLRHFWDINKVLSD